MEMKVARHLLPINVGDRVVLHPIGNEESSSTTCEVIGYRRGDYIIIENPKMVSKLPQNFNGHSMRCFHFHDGVLYLFLTKVRSYLNEGLALLEYPREVQEKKIRKCARIPVKLSAVLRLKDENGSEQEEPEDAKTFRCLVTDISEGGFCGVMRSFKTIPANRLCTLDFVLPDGQQIKQLEASICTSEALDEYTSRIGVKFHGPVSEQGKVFFFCQLCEAVRGERVMWVPAAFNFVWS